MDDYTEALKVDKEASAKYYQSSLARKTEQQKMLERMLAPLALAPANIADIACGGGGSTHHLASLYPKARYTLVDANEDAIAMAREATRGLDAQCTVGDINDLKLETGSFDLVICWQTLSWIDDPQQALRELVRICRPGARIYASSLFNVHHDVDVYSKIDDRTRPSSAQGLRYTYNTYSLASIRSWIGAAVSELRVHEFEIPIDLAPAGRGLGTFTARLDDGRRLQLSAGMLLNWGILELHK
ncbi:MAG TPA: methyltransferase domain-containing protein [Steroidobacteraceae bacterium]|nr:methyltransferase domain-containing protein [Steroidobacteraceae bacterium]